MEERKVRIIDADGLKQRIRAIFASENGSKRALPDAPLQITPQTIEYWIDTEPTVSEEKDPEDRASEMLDTYARGYNDGVKMTIYLMLKFKDALTDEEEQA